MTIVPVMWGVWGLLALITAAVYVYRSRLTRDEEDQIFLSEGFETRKSPHYRNDCHSPPLKSLWVPHTGGSVKAARSREQRGLTVDHHNPRTRTNEVIHNSQAFLRGKTAFHPIPQLGPRRPLPDRKGSGHPATFPPPVASNGMMP